MAKWFFANFKNSDIAIIIDPNVEESYVCASLAEELEDLFEVKIDKNEDFYMNFYYSFQTTKLELIKT